MSESMLTMVLEIEVERHKRELRDSFAAARARLIPPPREKTAQELFMEAIQHANAPWQTNAALANQLYNSYNSYGIQSQDLLCLFGQPNHAWF